MTFKGPSIGSPSRKGGSQSSKPQYKVREEIEFSVSDGSRFVQILDALGLRPVFRYEKFRTTYSFRGIPSVAIELDETPVGNYLELEGSYAAIDRAAARLGYARKDYLTETYGHLYLSECRRKGIKPTDMLFPAT